MGVSLLAKAPSESELPSSPGIGMSNALSLVMNSKGKVMLRKICCLFSLGAWAIANNTSVNAQTNVAAATVVTVNATDAAGSEIGPDPGVFTVSREGPT